MPDLTDPTSPGPKIGIVCGLQLEADWLDAAWTTMAGRVEIVVAGMGPARAFDAARQLATSGANALVSWGSAAGLDPAVGPGTVVLPRRVLSTSGVAFEADRAWLRRITGALGPSVPLSSGDLAEAGRILADAGAKAELGRQTGAVAADMESAAVAQAAVEADIPWIAVRAIADPAGEALPDAVLHAIGDDGAIDPAAVIRSAATSIHGMRSLLQLRRHHAAARRSMRRLAREAGLPLAVPETAAAPTPSQESP